MDPEGFIVWSRATAPTPTCAFMSVWIRTFLDLLFSASL